MSAKLLQLRDKLPEFYILSCNFRQTQQYANQLTHISLCVSQLIGILLCLTEIKAQYIVLIHNRMHSLKITIIFPDILHGYEIWGLTPREYHRWV
jgi:hypothetical protein